MNPLTEKMSTARLLAYQIDLLIIERFAYFHAPEEDKAVRKDMLNKTLDELEAQIMEIL